jgi:DNA-binding NtrC family response regulator
VKTEGKRPESMTDASVTPAAAPARLLLIEATSQLAPALAAPLAAEFSAAPIVVELASGRQAVELLRASPYDVVAADLAALADLAERNEDRIARLARAAAGALILVLSDDASISVALGAMRAGAHDCVARSSDAETLVQRIGDLARRHGKSRLLSRGPAADAGASESAAPSIPVMRDLVLPMWRQEQRIIESAIQSFAGNIALAAAALELSPSTIYRKRQAWAEIDGKRSEPATVTAR